MDCLHENYEQRVQTVRLILREVSYKQALWVSFDG